MRNGEWTFSDYTRGYDDGYRDGCQEKESNEEVKEEVKGARLLRYYGNVFLDEKKDVCTNLKRNTLCQANIMDPYLKEWGYPMVRELMQKICLMNQDEFENWYHQMLDGGTLENYDGEALVDPPKRKALMHYIAYWYYCYIDE